MTQEEQLKKLRSGNYEDASIYIVLLDLVEGNGLDEVFLMLHNVATDRGEREQLEAKFEECKNWEWEL